jgi:hypothetical protein
MKKKMAIIVAELVDESVDEGNEKIVQELLSWFHEDTVLIPWVKEIRDITVKQE